MHSDHIHVPLAQDPEEFPTVDTLYGPTRNALSSGSYLTLQCSLQGSTPECTLIMGGSGQDFCANLMDT